MADSSQQQISYQQEISLGEIDDSSPFHGLRFTGGSFPHSTETSRSEEVRPDGQRAGTIRTNVTAAPSVNIEFSPRTFDDLLEGVMRDEWSDSLSLTGSDISTTDNNDGTGSIESTEIDFSSVEPRQWVHVSGFSEDGVDGWYKVLEVNDESLTVAPAPSEASTSSEVTIEGQYLRNGTKSMSYALMRTFGDIDDKYEVIKGCRANQFDLSIESGSIVTGSISFEGLRKELMEEHPGTETEDAPGTEVFNAVDHVKAVLTSHDGEMAPVDADVMSANIALDQNARRQNAIGTLGAAGIEHGSLDATGSISLYLTADSWKYLESYVDFEKFGLAIAFSMPDGSYVFEFPRIALTEEPGNVPGPDDDVMLEFDFSAEPGEEYDKTVQIVKAVDNDE